MRWPLSQQEGSNRDHGRALSAQALVVLTCQDSSCRASPLTPGLSLSAARPKVCPGQPARALLLSCLPRAACPAAWWGWGFGTLLRFSLIAPAPALEKGQAAGAATSSFPSLVWSSHEAELGVGPKTWWRETFFPVAWLPPQRSFAMPTARCHP